MSLNDDLKNGFEADFLLVDGLEPITWERWDSDQNLTDKVDITYALRRAAKKDELFSERLVTGQDRVIVSSEVVHWHFLASAIHPNVPRKGDLLLDGDGVYWVVWEVKTQTMRTRFKCTCTRHSALA